MRFKIYRYRKIKSTNDQAIDLIMNKNIKTGYIHSEMQTFGRGTFGKKWISQKGNLFGSIFFPLRDRYPNFYEFSFINPVIIYRVIKNLCSSSNLALKWPNDILINKKKVCGILQEVIKKKNLDYLIIGIGINLIINPDIDKVKTANVFDETNIKIEKEAIIKKIVKYYEDFFSDINRYNFQYYKNKANFLSIKIGNSR